MKVNACAPSGPLELRHYAACSATLTMCSIFQSQRWVQCDGLMLRILTTLLVEMQTAQSLDIRVFEFQEFAKVGSANPTPAVPPSPQDLCTIMYTSGTTDTPKVRLDHLSDLHAVGRLVLPLTNQQLSV